MSLVMLAVLYKCMLDGAVDVICVLPYDAEKYYCKYYFLYKKLKIHYRKKSFLWHIKFIFSVTG